MKKTIGILGGMGPMATADLFKKIVANTRAGSDREHIRIYIDNNAQIPDRTAAILDGGEDPVPAMLDSLRKLEACGADCIIVPCNTAHYFVPRLQEMTDVPFVNMIEETAKTCATALPGKVAGLIATKGTLKTGLYNAALEAAEVKYLIPNEECQDALMRVIYDGVKADAEPESYRADMEMVIETMEAQGAQYFILACTELPLAFDALHLPQTAVDPTMELARAAIRFSGYQTNDLLEIPKIKL